MIPKSKKGNSYKITVEEIDSETDECQKLQFEFEDREDLFNLVENLKKGSGLEASDVPKVAVALRLLGPVMMQQRKHALFADFMPHFKAFMQHLKNTVKDTIQNK
ncbi:DUF3861 domain-containing protein [Vibrio sp. 1-Bac 57]